MNTSKSTEAIDQDRRRLLGATAGIAVAGAASLLHSQVAAAPAGDAIRPFRINVPDEAIVDLRRRPGSEGRRPSSQADIAAGNSFFPNVPTGRPKTVRQSPRAEAARHRGRPLLSMARSRSPALQQGIWVFDANM